MEEKLQKYLTNALKTVCYCTTCRNRKIELCNKCSVGSIEWEISQNAIDTMVKEITNIFKEATNAD